MNSNREMELQHKKAVGDDIVTLLTPGYSNKDEYSNAEGAYTTMQMTVAPVYKNSSHSDEISDDDIRNEY
jgi:hypothetical protein